MKVEQLTDKELDEIVALANAQWEKRPVRLSRRLEQLTPLQACYIIRAYLAVVQGDDENNTRGPVELFMVED